MEIIEQEDEDTSSEEEEDDISLDDDSNSSRHTSDSDERESCSLKFKKSKSKHKKHPDVQLSVLHNSNTDVCKDFFKYKPSANNAVKQASSLVKFGGYEKDFTPWWEQLSKKKNRPNYSIAQQAQKTDDMFNNWFNITPPGQTNWLCGPSPASVTDSVSKSKVEDIPVPSIYDRTVTTKGRRALKKERKAEKEKTTGAKWFGMKAPDMDEKLKMDMELIRMRGVLDPKRFYKNHDRQALPKYFQMGTVMDEGTDFYSSRLTKKQRKQNLVEELMADADIRQYNKRKYAELQQKMRVKQKTRPKPSKGHKKVKKQKQS